jgi:hypothetical protein
MTPPKKRRTGGIRREDPNILGADIALYGTTDAERAAARRAIDKAAHNDEDRAQLLAALGLDTP